MELLAELARLNPDPALLEKIQGMVNQAAAHQAERHTKDLKIQKLTLELAHLKRIRFGVKSEAFSAEQKQLFEDDTTQDLAAIEAELETPAPETRPRTPRIRAGRQPLPGHLERIEIRHEPETCTCSQCQSNLVRIGEDISEQLDIEPARFFVIRHIRPQYACRQCETIIAAPVDPAVIDGGMAAPGLLAWVAASKYLDHQPLYRLEQIADRLAEVLRQKQSLHADETPVQQLDPGKGKTRRAYLWAYRSNDLEGGPPLIVFDYQTSRNGKHATVFLEGWSGTLVVDDYAGYKSLLGDRVTEQACWAHARRKFFDLDNGTPKGHPVAAEILSRIARLYGIEVRGRDYPSRKRFLSCGPCTKN